MQTELQIQTDEEPYGKFLRSPQWRAISLLVIKRAGGICECCGVNPAVSAHHRDYRFGRLPPLFHLVATCRQCHYRLDAKRFGHHDPWCPK